MNTSTPKLSVILGSFNQKEVLQKVLEAFNAQTLAPEDYEIIVVDSSSTDGTAELLSTFKMTCHHNFIIQENKGKTAARNRGVSEAKAPLIMITDSDMIAHPDLLKTHVDAHAASKTPACFEGVTMDMSELHWPIDQSKLSPYIKEDIKDGKKLGWWYFLTGNVSFPRAIFDAENGFDETFIGYGWEDLELGYRLSRKKVPLYYLKNAINYHYHVITRDEEIQRNEKKGESAKVFHQIHPQLAWFLGLNPLSKLIFPSIRERGAFYSFIEKRCYRSTNKTLQGFGFWFLKEFHYMKGILKP